MEILTFKQWLGEYYPKYKIDAQSKEIVRLLGLWAFRDESFNIPSRGFNLHKGHLLTGNVGTGKTEIFHKLSQYQQYLQSPYRFRTSVVWQFAEGYQEQGNNIFNVIKSGNWYFDELALTNEEGLPYREMVQSFGNKALIGAELIMMRYNIYKRFGLQTHFSSNLTPVQLEKVYGKRCFSRLYEMCNFLDLTGKDRRYTAEPSFYVNENNYTPANPEIPTEQINAETKELLNSKYKQYLATGSFSNLTGTEFEIFKSLGVLCADDKELREIKLDVQLLRLEQINTRAVSTDEAKRFRELREMYKTKSLDREEESHLWMLTKKTAVQKFFQRLATEQQIEIFKTQ